MTIRQFIPPKHLVRLKILNVLLFTTFSFMVASCSDDKSKVEVKPVQSTPYKVQACYSSSSGADSIIWYAYEKGIFQKYNLDVNLIGVKGGAKAAIALVTKKADFCQMAGSAVVNAAVSGQDVVIIADFYKTSLFTLIVKPEIKTAKDLQNKILANNEVGGATDAALKSALKHLGLNPSQDVKLLRVGDHGDRLAAMAGEQVVGTALTAPLSFKAQAKGYQELLDIAALQLPYSYVGIVSTKSYLKQNPEITHNFLMANIEAIAMMKSDREGYIEVIAKYLKLDSKKDAAILNSTYESVVQKYLLDVPYPTLAGIQAILESAKETDPKAANFKPEDIGDLRYIRELENSGFIKKIKADVDSRKSK